MSDPNVNSSTSAAAVQDQFLGPTNDNALKGKASLVMESAEDKVVLVQSSGANNNTVPEGISTREKDKVASKRSDFSPQAATPRLEESSDSEGHINHYAKLTDLETGKSLCQILSTFVFSATSLFSGDIVTNLVDAQGGQRQ